MRRLTKVLLVFYVLCASHAQADTATFTIKVSNGTVGGSSVAGDQVTMAIYEGETEADVKTGIVAEDGTVSFEVNTGIGSVAVARVRHRDMLFGGNAVELRPGRENFVADVMVYDVSEDNSVLKIGTHHIIIRVRFDVIVVEEYIQIVNSTDRAVTSFVKDSEDYPVAFQVLLPKGYRDLECKQFFQMQALVLDDTGFYDIMAVPPGKHDAFFSYKLNIDSSKLNFVRPVTNSTSNVEIFAQLAGAKIDGLGEPVSPFSIDADNDSNYYMLDKKFEPGQVIEFKITGLKANSQDQLWIIFGVVFAVLVLVVIVRMRPKKK